ncbi:MAG: alpha/beta fold hydrolase [Chromatiaceae bacterium]|nr:alpha/beta fold hydrolase [Chromatiaceae bacterium]
MLELHVRTAGDPDHPAIVLLHGLFGSSANWGAIARHLSARYRVLTPDLRNHGQSPHRPDHSYPAMADDVLALLDDRQIATVALIGHSMGGKVAMQIALNHPQRVSGLAVVDMAPVRYTHGFEAVLGAFRAVDLAGIRSRADADAQMAARVSGSGVRAFLLQNLLRGPHGWAWRLNLDALAAAQAQIMDFPEQPAGAAFAGPASFVYGELSDYLTPAHEPAIRHYFPAASLCPVANAGHWVYADQPHAFMRCIEAFLSGVQHA